MSGSEGERRVSYNLRFHWDNFHLVCLWSNDRTPSQVLKIIVVALYEFNVICKCLRLQICLLTDRNRCVAVLHYSLKKQIKKSEWKWGRKKSFLLVTNSCFEWKIFQFACWRELHCWIICREIRWFGQI